MGLKGCAFFLPRLLLRGLENWLTSHLVFHGISYKALFVSFMVHLTDLLLRW
ncbi:hypothetical protein THIARS_60226 [Thiomonas delicata]|uniref:Uncharacterized protein n=1 Tax=Thiomonas delicata TaxID=364030 RepID=A0A238D2N4_THIDL|nr:hypothetical protein THIARS_60226 [Thiomonas delicata]